jgi:hypothetical protein
MPQYHKWFQPTTIGNAARRERDRQRKSHSRGLRGEHIPQLADYVTIDRCIYQRRNIGGHIVDFYTLRGIAEIFNLAPATVQRWFDLYMLPTPAQWEIFGNAGETIYAYADNARKRPLYSKPQVLIICTVLNDLFEQGYRQFRQSHIHHIEMMRVGCDIAMRRLTIKLSKPPKQPLPILPSPQQRIKSRGGISQPLSYPAYRPTDCREWLLSL